MSVVAEVAVDSVPVVVRQKGRDFLSIPPAILTHSDEATASLLKEQNKVIGWLPGDPANQQ